MPTKTFRVTMNGLVRLFHRPSTHNQEKNITNKILLQIATRERKKTLKEYLNMLAKEDGI